MSTLAELGVKIEDNDLPRAKTKLKDLGDAAAKTEQQAAGAEKQFKKTGAAAKGMSQAAANSALSMDRLTSSMKRLVAQIGLMFALRAGVDAMVQWEDVMAQLAGVTDATAVEMEAFKEIAREVGANSSKSAIQAAEAMLELSRAGFEMGDVMGMTPHVLNLSTASMMSLSDAAELTATTLKQFQLAATETERIVDVLVSAADMSTASVQQMGSSLEFVGPIANTFNIAIEDAAAALAVLADAGMRAEKGGTNLRGILAALSRPVGDAKARIDELAKSIGVTAASFDPMHNSLSEIFMLFQKAKASPKDFNQIFGRLQQAGGSALAAGAEQIAKLEKALRSPKTRGAAAQLAKLMEDTLGGSLRRFKNALIETMIALDESAFGRVLKNAIDVVTSFIHAFMQTDSVVANLSPLMKTLAFASREVLTVWIAMKTLQFAQQMWEAVKAVGGLTKAMKALKAAIAGTGIGLIAVALGTAIALIWEFWDATIELEGGTVQLGDIVSATWDYITETIISAIDSTGEYFKSGWEGLVKFFSDTGDAIADGWNNTSQHVTLSWQGVVSTLTKLLKGLVNVFIGTFVAIWKGASRLIDAVDRLTQVDATDFEGMGRAFSDAFSGVGSELQTAFTRDYLGEGLSWMQQQGAAAGGAFSGAFADVQERALALARAREKREEEKRKARMKRGATPSRLDTREQPELPEKEKDRLQALEEIRKKYKEYQQTLRDVMKDEQEMQIGKQLLEIELLFRKWQGLKVDDVIPPDLEKLLGKIQMKFRTIMEEIDQSEKLKKWGEDGKNANAEIERAANDAAYALAQLNTDQFSRTVSDTFREMKSQINASQKAIWAQLQQGIITIDEATAAFDALDAKIKQIGQDRARLPFAEEARDLEKEMRSMFLTFDLGVQDMDDFRRTAAAAMRAYGKSIEGQADSQKKFIAYQKQMIELIEKFDQFVELDMFRQQVVTLTGDVTVAFATMWEDIISGALDTKQAFAKFAKDVAAIFFKTFVTEQLAKLATNAINNILKGVQLTGDVAAAGLGGGGSTGAVPTGLAPTAAPISAPAPLPALQTRSMTVNNARNSTQTGPMQVNNTENITFNVSTPRTQDFGRARSQMVQDARRVVRRGG